MLLPDSRLTNIPVMSLQTGGELARTARPIIDPRNLTIVAFELAGEHLDELPTLLRVNDIRETGTMGFIIDSNDEFIGVDDVIKIKQIYLFDFRLIDVPVLDERKHKLGAVSGFTYEPNGFVIQQLNVRQPFLKSLIDTEKLIHRSQIISVKDDAIVVRSPNTAVPAKTATRMSQYSNPFRSPNTQPDSIAQSDTN